MCVNLLSKNMHVSVQLKMLSDSAFLIYFTQYYASMSLHEMLFVLFEEWIGEVELIRWTPEYGSVGCVFTRFVQLHDLPCILSSVPIIEYILGPFASYEKSYDSNK
jgi:hypothetical protein